MSSHRLYNMILVVVVATSAAAAFSPSNLLARLPARLLSSSSNAIDDFDDFAEFSSTQLAPSSVADNDNDDSFLSSLQSRVRQVQERSDKLVSGTYPPPPIHPSIQSKRSNE